MYQTIEHLGGQLPDTPSITPEQAVLAEAESIVDKAAEALGYTATFATESPLASLPPEQLNATMHTNLGGGRIDE